MQNAKVRRRRAMGPLTLRTAPGNRCRGLLQAGHLTFPAAIGRSGTSIFKREGDGCTPVAAMPVLAGYRRAGRVSFATSPLALRAIRPTDLWCDAPWHAAYNRPVQAPFSARHEKMARKDGLYDLCLVLDWNISSRKRFAGSAIFFHLCHADFRPTEGCIAIPLRTMLRLLPLIRKGTVLRVLK